MNDKFVPKIGCRFKIRRDIDCFVGFFRGKGVLTFNEIGAFIVGQMNGENNLQKIAGLVKNTFPAVLKPRDEVMSIAKQLQRSGFFYTKRLE